MRVLVCFSLFVWVCSARAQDRILLNEVLPGNQGITTDSAGRTPDWIELFNPTARPIDLNGWRVAMAGRQHVFTQSLTVAPKSYSMVWCDGRLHEGADHIAFKLAREGGALLLIAPDGITIADVFSYPAIPGNVSIGRFPNAAKSWSFFAAPTPGTENRSTDGLVQGQCSTPVPDRGTGCYEEPFTLELRADDGAVIHYSLDGSQPSRIHSLRYDGPLSIAQNTVVRAIAWSNGHLTSAPLTATFVIGPPVSALTLTLAPADLWNDSTGIYTAGAFNNNTRSGKAWEREGVVQWSGEQTAAVGVRISGSGSRGARKRSFKLYARDEAFAFDDSSHVDEGLLRADATPHAFLRNTTMEELARRFGLDLAVQPSVAVPLYLNAKPWGLYRWMPSKDAEWLRQQSAAEAMDVLEGPAFNALSGSNDHFLRAQEMLVRAAPMDSLDAVIDLGSLIDLACMDLWTGRADHELNVRCYRPREKGGRWRWVLYDMDLWAPPNENSVQRMSLAAEPSTPFVPQLLARPELQQRLLARITAMQAAVFSQVEAVADSIHGANATDLMADFRRWELELGMPHPDSSLAAMRAFATTRPPYLFGHLARHTGRKTRTVVIDVPPADQATLLIQGLPLAPGRHTVRCFSGVRVPLEVRMRDGYEFAWWKGADLDSANEEFDLSRAKNIRPILRAVVP